MGGSPGGSEGEKGGGLRCGRTTGEEWRGFSLATPIQNASSPHEIYRMGKQVSERGFYCHSYR